MPTTITGSFSGTAQAFSASLANEPLLIAAAIAAVYVVLGILYESYIHPITILSTLPSAGVGALLALLITHTELSIIALIGIILLIGIVKKNAIMMIDFALEVERRDHKSPKDAVFQACLLRFRPIMMTTMAALLGGVPLALGTGMGSELRRPLGIAIVGGLIVSQVLTLYTTPVIYLYMDRLNTWISKFGFAAPPEGAAAAGHAGGIMRRAMHALGCRRLAPAGCIARLMHGLPEPAISRRTTSGAEAAAGGTRSRKPAARGDADRAGLEDRRAEDARDPRAVVGGLRRSQAQRARGTGRHLEPDHHRGRGELSRRACAGAARRRRAVSHLEPEPVGDAREDRAPRSPASAAASRPAPPRRREARRPARHHHRRRHGHDHRHHDGSSPKASRPPPHNIFDVPLEASYQIDLWGSIRNNVAENRYAAQASAAQLANALLSTQSTLAQDYFQLRVADEQRRILETTLSDYQASLHLVQTLFNNGLDSDEDVASARDAARVGDGAGDRCRRRARRSTSTPSRC